MHRVPAYPPLARGSRQVARRRANGSRIANQGPSPGARHKPARVPRFSRNTRHETRITAFFTVGAQGTRNRKPPPGPPRTPPGRCFPGRCGAAWCGYGAAWAAHCPRAGVRAPSAVLARPHDARRSLGIPEKCTKSRFPQENASSAALAAVPVALRLLPVPRTPSEPMLRKGYDLSCANRGTVFIALIASLFSLRPSAWVRKMRECARSAAMEGTRGGPRPTTGGTRRAYKKISRCGSLHISPRGEAKCVRGPSGRGESRLARAGVLEQYVEHGKQAQRSPGGRIVCFDRRVVRNAGQPAYLTTRRDMQAGLPVYSPARGREPAWREPRIVCAASQDTSTSQGTRRPRSEPPC